MTRELAVGSRTRSRDDRVLATDASRQMREHMRPTAVDKGFHLLCWLVVICAAPLLSRAAGGEVLSGSSVLNSQPTFLRAEEAFVLSTKMDGATLIASWRIADGYYIYRSRTTLTAEAGTDVRVGAAEFTPGKHKTDEYFGDVEVYYHDLRVRLPVLAGSAGKRVKITYQGCADAGLCYPPQTKWFVLPADLQAGGSAGDSSARAQVAGSDAAAPDAAAPGAATWVAGAASARASVDASSEVRGGEVSGAVAEAKSVAAPIQC